MLQSLKDAECLHTDHHDANVISPVVNSIDEAGRKNDKAGDKKNQELTQQVSKIDDASFPSLSPEIRKNRRKKSRSRKE